MEIIPVLPATLHKRLKHGSMERENRGEGWLGTGPRLFYAEENETTDPNA